MIRTILLILAGMVLGLVAVPLLPNDASEWVSRKNQAVSAWFDNLSESSKTSTTASPKASADVKNIPTPLAEETTATRLTDSELDELRRYAVALVNRDRADQDLPPVTLGSNRAAQLHAEDMLENDYLGHWWSDGRKPYMVYTQTGGNSYVSENVASSGWTLRKWEENRCNSFLVNCRVSPPKEAIQRAEWSMVYDDAHSDWGHRDNILGASHRLVNIGIAVNDRRTVFVQHFEGGDVAVDNPPEISADGTLSLTLTKLVNGIDIGSVVTVYYDPTPSPKSAKEIDALDRYCVGGGFTTACGEPVARILKPPGPGLHYSNLDYDVVVADYWRETDTGFEFTAQAGSSLAKPGVYTFVVWLDAGDSVFNVTLLQLSAFRP